MGWFGRSRCVAASRSAAWVGPALGPALRALLACVCACTWWVPRLVAAEIPQWQRADPRVQWMNWRKAPLWETPLGLGDQALYSIRVALTNPKLDEVRAALDGLRLPDDLSDTARIQLGEAYLRVGRYGDCWRVLAPLVAAARTTAQSRSTGAGESPLLSQAMCLSRDGQPTAAAKLLHDAIRRGDETAATWFLLGETLARQGQWSRAYDAFARSLQIQRTGSAAWAAAVAAELAFGQIEGERAAAIAVALDSRLSGWRRQYLGSSTTAGPTISAFYEATAQAIIYRALERYAEALVALRAAKQALTSAGYTPAGTRAVGERLATMMAYVGPLAARGDVRTVGVTAAQGEALVGTAMPALRACLRDLADVVYEVRVVRGSAGPAAKPIMVGAATPQQLEAATACFKRVGAGIALPSASPSPRASGRPAPSPAVNIILAGMRPAEVVFKVVAP